MKLKKQIHAVILIISSVILLSALAVSYYVMRRGIINTAYQSVINDTLYTAISVEKESEKYSSFLKSLAFVVRSKNDFRKFKDSWLIETAPEIGLSGLYAGYNDGTMEIISGWKPSEESDFRTQPWYKHTIESGELTISDSYENPNKRAKIISISVPLRDRNGSVFGVLNQDVRLDVISGRVMAIKSGRDTVISIIDGNGTIIADSNPSLIGKSFSEFQVLNELVSYIKHTNRANGIEVRQISENLKIFSWTYVNEGKWILLLETGYDRIFSSLNRLVLAVLLTLLLLFIIIWFVSRTLSDKISGPIERITDMIDRTRISVTGEVTSPQFSMKSGIDEVNTLYNSFNGMIDRISLSVRRHNESEEKYRELVENSPDLIYILDADLRFVSMNKKMQSMLGHDGDDLTGMRLSDFNIPKSSMAILEMLHQQVFEKKHIVIEEIYDIEMITRTFSFSIILLPQFKDGTVTGITGTVRDITKLKKYENEVNYLAYYDSITQLPNINSLRLKLPGFLLQADGSSEKLAAIVIKIDNFKLINDTLGFSAGDLLLDDIAVSLSIITSRTDFLARIGGDQFIILNFLSKDKSIEKFIHKIMSIFRNSRKIGQYEISTTVSIGVSIYPDDADDPEEFLKNANTALTSARSRSGNSYQLFDESIKNELMSRFVLQNKLKKALDNMELFIQYQPIANTRHGIISGFEALARWTTSDNEKIPPDIFISMAEKIGEIHRIGFFILEHACKTVKKWNDESGLDIFICVNVSPVQLNNPSFISDVSEIIKNTGIKPHWLELEITEGIFIDSFDRAYGIMMDLKDLGIRLALDDFGTGYSSLSYLGKLPFDTIKIDKSFIDTIEYSDESHVIVESVINLIHRMNLRIITEGVETSRQYKIISEFACDYVQGYLISRPLQEETAFDFMQQFNSAHKSDSLK